MGRFILAILLVLCIQSLTTHTFPKVSKEKKKVASVSKPKESYTKEEDEAVKAADPENPVDEPTENEDEESEDSAEENAKFEKSEEKPVKVSKSNKLTYMTRVILHKGNQFKIWFDLEQQLHFAYCVVVFCFVLFCFIFRIFI